MREEEGKGQEGEGGGAWAAASCAPVTAGRTHAPNRRWAAQAKAVLAISRRSQQPVREEWLQGPFAARVQALEVRVRPEVRTRACACVCVCVR